MTDELVEQIVVSAVQRAYDDWAVEHPSLAAVIDQVSLTARAAESLRESPEYAQAVTEYHQGRSHLTLLEQFVGLAGQVLKTILAS